MKKKILGSSLFFAVFLLLGAGCTSLTVPDTNVSGDDMNQNAETDVMIDEGKGTGDVMMEDNSSEDSDMITDDTQKVTFALSGKNFAFMMDGEEAPVLTVKKGTTVHIDFTSESGFHDWVVDEFGAATTQVQTGGTTSVEFVADEVGTFEYYCSVGQHRANGMVGTLIVE